MSSTSNPGGCCTPAAALTKPANRPGLPALSYRIGTYATFLRNMLAKIHSVTIPDGPNQGARPLAQLTTRASDDPAIALMDAWAVVADVLTFYQERIANEGYLRTAGERLSILQLARMIGYELGPGVAASTYLAFTVDDSRGAPPIVSVGAGTKVQNIPPQGKLPQTFETIEDIQAYANRNTLRPRLTRPQDLALVFDPTHQFDPNGDTLELYMLGIDTSFPPGSFVNIPAAHVYPLEHRSIPDPVAAIPLRSQLYLAGTSTNLQKGDRLLLVGRNDDLTPPVQTKVMIVRGVDVHSSENRTRIDFRDDLGQAPAPPPFTPPWRQHVTIFSEVATLNRANLGLVIKDRIRESDLRAYIHMSGWEAFDVSRLAYRVLRPRPPVPPPPNPSAKLPAPDPGIFALRTHAGFFGNNGPSYTSLLAPQGQGFPKPGSGNFLYPNDWDASGWEIWKDSISGGFYQNADVYLEQVVPGVLRDSWIVLEQPSGDPAVYRVGFVVESALTGFGVSGRATGLRLTTIDGTTEITVRPSTYKVRTTVAYAQSELLVPAELPVVDDILPGTTELMLDNLVVGLNVGQPVALTGTRTENDAPGLISNEILLLQDIAHVAGFTILEFANPTMNSYVRSTVTINANVARATHGETVQEILGSGDASQANQRFTLKRPPLTYVPAPVAGGIESTLNVRVNDLLWNEEPSLYGAGPRDQDYIVRREDDGTTSITFGDGVTGARLPSGQQNIAATYRTGIGPNGNVDAGSLSLLQTRPPGIRAVTNPVAANGAAAPEVLEHARSNAPLETLTLGRIVSIDDYENFARAFAGIGKARAVALWSGDRSLVHLTIAGANGEAIDPASALYASLIGAIDHARDPVQMVLVASYQPIFFDVDAGILVNQPRYLPADVLAAVNTALLDAFSFARRSFGQPVTAAEVTTVIQSVPGVIAVDLNRLFPVTTRRGVRRFEGLAPVLCAAQAQMANGRILPAELLLINPAGLTLTVLRP